MKQYLVILFALVFVVGCNSTRNGEDALMHSSAPAMVSEPTILYDKLSKPAVTPLPNDGMQAQPESLIREDEDEEMNTEAYNIIYENAFTDPRSQALSTFSIDVDRAAYANIRRFLNDGQAPPAGAVRIEEMINYFNYNYPQPADQHPFSINTELAACPWNAQHQLLSIGLQGKTVSNANLPPNNLVFLLDVSGSMNDANKLPLLKQAFRMLTDGLREQDVVSVVVYAGAAGLVLPPTHGNEKTKILDALSRLEAGGSTAGGEGIALAYKVAAQNFMKEGNNRIILATDGDFNVGTSSDAEMERLITEKRKTGVYLSCLGFGGGNYKDSKMETLADKGNGNYAYIDNENEAKKVLTKEMGGTLLTIAKDVKIQIEFNPTKVQGYRLIGYENRLLAAEDFEDDTKDAGELGAGHTVTALYEIIPVGVKTNLVRKSPNLKYQTTDTQATAQQTNELCTVKFRYKPPQSDKSIEMVHTQNNQPQTFEQASNNIRFASSVALAGMLLRKSEYKGTGTYNMARTMAINAKGEDTEGYRAEFITLIDKAKNVSKD